MSGKNLTSKNSKNETFRRFQDFEWVLWLKTKTRKRRKSTESFLNKKTYPLLTITITGKLIKTNQFVI